MAVPIEHETPDSLAQKILAARRADEATAGWRSAREVERAERDGYVARELVSTAALARLLAD